MLDSWIRNEYISFLLVVFSLYRLAHLVAVEEGPFGVFLKIRLFSGSYVYDEDDNITTALGRMMVCPLCLGIYFALVLLVVLSFYDGWMRYGLLWLGLSGGQAFLHNVARARC